MNCTIIMHRSWEACLRELPWVCGRGLSLVGVSSVFDKGIGLNNDISIIAETKPATGLSFQASEL